MVISAVVILEKAVECPGDPFALVGARADKLHPDKVVQCSPFEKDPHRIIQYRHIA